MVDQKGFDLIAAVAGELPLSTRRSSCWGPGSPVSGDVDPFGGGPPGSNRRPIGFDEIELAHLIEGGADIFLMPSRFEPCGLNQITV